MSYIKIKTKLVFLPFLLLGICFIIGYSLLYWLLYIQFHIIPLKVDIAQIWIPIGLAFIFVLLIIRPRVHILKLDRNNGRIRTLYYMVAAAVFCIPLIIALTYLESATGKLTALKSIREIAQRPATKYYQPDSYVLFKDKIGIESVISYSGKHNENYNFDIYIAMPFAADLQDTLQSPAAFLAIHYHKQLSSKISDQERTEKWNNFWDESFQKFDSTQIQFNYLVRMGNTEQRDHLQEAAHKSVFYQTGNGPIILEAVNKPFEKRNGGKLFNIFLSFIIGLVVWFIMIIIPGLHLNKAENIASCGQFSAKNQLIKAINVFKPVKGFVATPLLILLNVSIFIFMVLKGLGFVTFYTRDLVPLGAIYEPAIQEGEWWRLVTGIFLHGGVVHLVMNMVSLYLAGIFLEMTIGTKRFILGYLLSGIIAGLISLWWHDKPVVAVGASGAIFGLYGIILALIAFKIFDAALNKLLLTLLACTAGYGLLMGFLSKGIDNSAHVGGLAAGFILGVVFAKTMKGEKADENSPRANEP